MSQESAARSSRSFIRWRVVKNLAHVYVMIGEYDLAFDQLGYLLSIPSSISVPLEHDPRRDPLRIHSRYAALIQKYKLVE